MTGENPPGSGKAGPPHVPVMLGEVIAALAPVAGEVFIDGTFGAGGYTRAILEAANCRVLALDRDPDAIAEGATTAGRHSGRLLLANVVFSDMQAAASEHGFDSVNGVVLDLGVSSMQLDRAARGFSFQADGPLDMRMSQSGRSAADIVNEADEATIAAILRTWGEERQAGRIARAIVREREQTPITTTRRLAAIVERVLGRSWDERKHPATRTFQALRIAVNDELAELRRALEAAERLLKTGGRLVIVTFHSEEDRTVKRFLQQKTGKVAGASRHGPPVAAPADAPSFRFVNHRPLTPSQREIELNPRSRSAKLRFAIRTGAPPSPTHWERDDDPTEKAGSRRR
jgi:16S rRNA (cytosine1402-N4)-methyltransferase